MSRNKIGELIKKVEKLDTKKTLAEIENELNIYKNDIFFYDKNKVQELEQAKELLLLENIKQEKQKQKLQAEIISNEFFNIMQDNISYYKNSYTKNEIITQMNLSNNKMGYINTIMNNHKEKNYNNFWLYNEAFKLAYKNIKDLYSGDIQKEKQKLKEQKQTEKYYIRKQKQNIINNIFVTGLFIALDRKLKKNN